ncbi:MAG: RNA 2',3'-cyclic phosphodiesterase [Thermoplasmata archaeon]|nr:RNA 2',3'-cyclic phosphodiesterase [Thermoplasmata archaeon]
MFRGFIAVDIESNDRLDSFSAGLGGTGANLKLVDLSKVHITLKFLGNTREDHVPRIKEILIEGVKGIEPFDIELVGTGAFPNLNRMRVVWVGTRNAERLGKIASYLEDELESLGYGKERRGFSPHLTIARVRGGGNLDAVKGLVKENGDEVFGRQLVDRIVLKKSDLTPKGPIYTVVEEAIFRE